MTDSLTFNGSTIPTQTNTSLPISKKNLFYNFILDILPLAKNKFVNKSNLKSSRIFKKKKHTKRSKLSFYKHRITVAFGIAELGSSARARNKYGFKSEQKPASFKLTEKQENTALGECMWLRFWNYLWEFKSSFLAAAFINPGQPFSSEKRQKTCRFPFLTRKPGPRKVSFIIKSDFKSD